MGTGVLRLMHSYRLQHGGRTGEQIRGKSVDQPRPDLVPSWTFPYFQVTHPAGYLRLRLPPPRSTIFVLFSMIAFRSKLGAKLGVTLDKPMAQRACAWIDIFGFMIATLSKRVHLATLALAQILPGISSFLVIRLWFGIAVDDFNQSIEFEGDTVLHLMVGLSNGFTMVWVD